MESMRLFTWRLAVGNGNGNGIVGKWIVDPFCEGNRNNTHMHFFLFPLPLQSTSYEQISNEIVAVAVAM